MKNLQVTGRFKVLPEHLDQFKFLVEKCIKCTLENDIHTLQYDWFCNKEQTEWAVREIFKDSEAAIVHFENLGDLIDDILEIAEYYPEIYGNPTQEFLNVAAGFVPQVYAVYHHSI